MTILVAIFVLCIATLVLLCVVVPFTAHVSRYRHHLRMYPGARDIRGRVWKHTA